MKKILIILFIITILLINGCSVQTQDKSKVQLELSNIQSCENSVLIWAENMVRDDVRVEIINNVDQEYPQLSTKDKESIIYDQLQNALAENKDLIDQYKEEFYKMYCGEEILPNGKILTENGYKINIEYMWNEQNFQGIYIPGLRATAEWIKDNIEEDAKITSWWDYNAMIRAISQRDVVLSAPSNEFIIDYKKVYLEWSPSFEEGQLADHVTLLDVSNILATTDSQVAIDLMDKHNSKYLLVTKKDAQISHVINRWVTGNYTYPSEDSILFQALNEDLDGFDLIYVDDNAVIYKVK